MFDIFWGSFTGPFSGNISNIIDICIHMNLPESMSFTYEKLQNVQNVQSFGGRRRNRVVLMKT